MGDRGDRLTPACSDWHKKNWNECLCSDTTLQSYGYSYTGRPSIYLTEVINGGGKDLEGPYELLLLVMLGSEVIGKIFLVSPHLGDPCLTEDPKTLQSYGYSYSLLGSYMCPDLCNY
ncbi:uncharacterized protein LOC124683520 isoform X2 [Lolium rigidum]|uniref:uncharacterized protein LOC124683520 isoform X2 n=1 Tax=Lolium rigidum TaxID=89674 RepID=UPI001F5DD6C1|nr:uncharacterized protein LOC124683520 isoform X2 [Lolium rigidum]